MPVIDTNNVRPGMTIMHDGRIMQVMDYQHVKPGKGGAFVRVKLRDVLTGRVLDHTWKGFQKVEQAVLQTHDAEFIYREGDLLHFMDPETYEQQPVDISKVGDKAEFLKENLQCKLLVHEGEVLSVELPDVVTVKVVETDPGVRGDTATGGSKPAKVETGAVVKVPLFVDQGEMIRVDTRTGEYLERAK